MDMSSGRPYLCRPWELGQQLAELDQRIGTRAPARASFLTPCKAVDIRLVLSPSTVTKVFQCVRWFFRPHDYLHTAQIQTLSRNRLRYRYLLLYPSRKALRSVMFRVHGKALD
jgi:hypothetical protein